MELKITKNENEMTKYELASLRQIQGLNMLRDYLKKTNELDKKANEEEVGK